MNGEDAMVTVLFIDMRAHALVSRGMLELKGKTAPVAVYAPAAAR